MTKNKLNKRGQTILEAIIAVTIIAAITTGLVAVTVKTLKASQFARTKSQSLKYAQEGVEIVRNLRNTIDWTTFRAYSTIGTWYLGSSGSITDSGCDTSITPNVANTFVRCVTFSGADPQKVQVKIDVYWTDGTGVLHDSPLLTEFSQTK